MAMSHEEERPEVSTDPSKPSNNDSKDSKPLETTEEEVMIEQELQGLQKKVEGRYR